jgi:uncharacterized repeat protein (TIGR03809 family)
MIPWQSTQRMDAIAQKWRKFAELRREHYLELYRSGRWSEFYTEAQFIALVREVQVGVDRWAELAPPEALPAPRGGDVRPHFGSRGTAA